MADAVVIVVVIFVDAIGCTLYSCLILGDYVFVVLSSVLQLMTLGSFALSAFPSGPSSLRGEQIKSQQRGASRRSYCWCR